MSDRRLDVRPLISHRFSIGEASRAYEVVTGAAPSLGILLEYPASIERPETDVRAQTVQAKPSATTDGHRATIGFIGSGNYATAVLIPAFKATGARLRSVASSGGVSGSHAAKKVGFEMTTTDTRSLLADPTINAVAIATRHDGHARLVCDAFRAGKHVFVEKPLAINLDELEQISEVVDEASGSTRLLMVGFNRRFAPHVKKIYQLLSGIREPKAFVMTVNAGAIPVSHWTQDASVGGGRIIGEACHFIDLLRYLAGARIRDYDLARMQSSTSDSVSIQLGFEDGSIGTVHYLANWSKSFPKERLDVFAAGRVLQLDNFRKLTGFGFPGFTSMRLLRQDKGQKACAAAFVNAVETKRPSPIPLEDIFEVARVTIHIANG
jgi:predicted dehydrogenase